MITAQPIVPAPMRSARRSAADERVDLRDVHEAFAALSEATTRLDVATNELFTAAEAFARATVEAKAAAHVAHAAVAALRTNRRPHHPA